MAASPCTPAPSYDTLQVGTKPTVISFLPDLGVTASLSYAFSPNGLAIGDTGEVAQTSTMPPWKYIELDPSPPKHPGPL